MKKSYANISTVKTLEVNSTTVQTFLCLAFGELAVGNISKAWLLSGMAFRSLQDIGLQYDGQAGRSKDGRSIPELDSEIRRRIYWGCYTADSMIALLLGRPVFFQDFDAAVSPSEQLPDNVTLMAWLPDETEDQQIPRLIPFFKGLGGLSKICHQLLLHVFTVQSSLSGSSTTTVAALQRFDLSLCRWHNNLDSTLRWNRWKSQAPSTSNHVFLLHLYYLSLRLCVLEELLGRSGDCDKQKLFHKTSDELIEDIAQLLRQIMSSSRIFRPPVIMIYATAVAIHSSQRLASRSELQSSQEHHHARSQVLLKTLRACGQAWAFARQVHDQLSSKALDISTTGEQVPNRSSQHQEVRLERSAETGGTTLHANTDPRPPDNLMEEGYSDLTGDPLDGSFNLPGFIFSLGTLTHPLEDCMF
ncbi:hypothetical protein AAFC00_006504 [Neodothiora populina]|uniref:Xylanolytic transcriptional activator regulatory domain-containing protein n=1 Tax=Neodothiora populina TaxID=2781224 RepID=A0ABR3PA79_9PEZI